MDKCKAAQDLKENFTKLAKEMLDNGFTEEEICVWRKPRSKVHLYSIAFAVTAVLLVCFHQFLYDKLLKPLQAERCLLPNNYFIWEATRPVSDCSFCINVTQPSVFSNDTKEYSKHFYSSRPTIIKRAVLHWPAVNKFDFSFFKNLYDGIEDAYKISEEDCQFLHFHSNFASLKDVFSMSQARARNDDGEKPWYIGWENCHPRVLEEMRKYYPVPHFLPSDSEMPSNEHIFMGYSQGATMHLDFISRLMWQAQLKGNKTWHLLPIPECRDVCQPIGFYVEPGDAVLLDTRLWYHRTVIAPGQFSLSIQSEYG